MKKKVLKAVAKKPSKKPVKVAAPVKKAVKSGEKKSFLVLLKSWMFVVMFALMLGMGAIVGTFLQVQMNAATPTVAGVSTELGE
jgi:hypothetical protein